MSSESREEKTWYTHALVLCVSLTSKSMGKKKKQNQHTHKYACIKKARTFNLIIVKTKLQSDLQQLPTAKQKVCETRR